MVCSLPRGSRVRFGADSAKCLPVQVIVILEAAPKANHVIS